MRKWNTAPAWLAIAALTLTLGGTGCSSKAMPKKLPEPAKTTAKPMPKPVMNVQTVPPPGTPKPPPPKPVDNGGDDYVNGQRYYSGDGVPQDYLRASEYFRKAAQKGHAYAMYSLGLMFEHGYGAKRDVGEAAYWYRRAADAGDNRASGRLAALNVAAPVAGAARNSSLISYGSTEAAAAPSLPAGTELIKQRAEAEIVYTPRPIAPPEAPRPIPPPAPVAAAPTPAPAPRVSAPAAAAPAAVVAIAPKPVPVAPAPAPVTPRPQSQPPPAAPAPAPASNLLPALPLKQKTSEMSPTTAQAMADYQLAMRTGNYGLALGSLERAREAGEITALGLNETQSAEELARMAILANDGNLAQVYLRQASALGSARASDALIRLSGNPDLRLLSDYVSRDGVAVTVTPPPAATAEPPKKRGLVDRLFGGGS